MLIGSGMGVAVGVSVMVGVRLGVDVLVAVPVGAGRVGVLVGRGGGVSAGRQPARVTTKMIPIKVNCLIYKL